MAHYRIHTINSDGHVTSAIDLDCADKAAIESAKQFIADHGIELWQGDHLIPKFESAPK